MNITSNSRVDVTIALDPAEQFLTTDGSGLVTEVRACISTFRDGTTYATFLCSGLKRTKSGAFGTRVHHVAIPDREVPLTIRDAAVIEARKSIAVVLGRLDIEGSAEVAKLATDWQRVIQEAK